MKSSPEMGQEEALLTGAVFGTLLHAGLPVSPVMAGEDYTDQIVMPLGEPFENWTAVLTVRVIPSSEVGR